MKNRKKLLFSSFVGAAMLFSLPVVVVACSDSGSNTQTGAEDKKVSELITKYRDDFDKVVGDQELYQYTDDNVNDLLKVVNDTKANLSLIDESLLSQDGKIWIDSFKEELETKKLFLESKIHYLILDQWDRLGFTNYTSWLASKIQSVVTKLNNSSDVNEIKDWSGRLNVFIDKVIKNLTDGVANNITQSGIMAKHSIGNLLQKPFMQKILDDYAQTGSAKSYDDLKNANKLPINTQSHALNANQEVVTQLDSVNRKIMDLVKYVTNDYYKAIAYGGNTNKAFTLTIQDAPTNEEDNGYKFTQNSTTKYLAGLGFTEADINVNDIGVGFMKNAEYGQKIYKALIRKHSNTTKTPTEIFTLGNDGVAQIKNNMKEVAKTVAEIFVGKNAAWSATGEFYDQDSSQNAHGAVNADSLLQDIVGADGSVNLPKFFTWLNTNRWFNGRDMLATQFPTLNGTDELFSEYQGASGANPITDWVGTIPYKYIDQFNSKHGLHSVAIADIIGDKANGEDEKTKVWGDAGNLAYKYLVKGLSPATVQDSNTVTNLEQTNSISPESAFIGASHAISQYLQFKDNSVKHYAGLFKETPVDYTLRTGTGGAAYASSGKGGTSWADEAWGGFYLDSNPYFGLQKWSMTTLATHEGVTGHVYQYNYAATHPAVDYAPTFDSTAYAEGWGLFSEWLAVQVGMYGTPKILSSLNDNKLQLPEFGVNSKNVDVTQFKNKYEYANGAYWVGDDATGANSQKLFDAVQYFGFLNERQLRAMRCAVDVGIHAGGAAIDQDGNVANSSQAGQFSAGSGWSLKQARDYLSKNSGLGIDDIRRETKRYLEYTGQAVSYYNGLIVMENLWMKALDKFTQANPGKQFIDWENPSNTRQHTEGLFDIILRNGDVPIGVLEKEVSKWINENIK